MKHLLFLILLPFLCAFTVTATPPAVVIQSESVAIHVKADGSVERNVSITMKLNTFQALRTVGEWFYSYNPKLEQVEILKSVTIHKDGSRFPAPKNAILDQTPSSVENAPDFSNIREKMVSHTGLEPGCTVEFQYKTTDLEPHRIGVLEPMGGPWPIHRKTVSVQLDCKADIHVNGSIRKTANGAYEVKNTRSMRPAFGFSNTTDLPFLYIEIDTPVSRLKRLMEKEDNPASAVPALLKLKRGSTAMEVETALNHLLNKQLVTIHLEPELTGWGIRPLTRIVCSGYATPLEKTILGHAVLQAYNIPHTALLKTDKIGAVPIATGAEFQLNAGLCTLNAAHQWKPAFLLYGDTLPEPVQTAVFVTTNLKEQKDGTFTGTITAQKKGNGANFSLSALNPVKDATVSNETVLTRTENNLVKTGKLTLKLKNGQIQLNPVLAQTLHLPALEHAILNATSIRMPEPCTGVVHLTIEFAKKPETALPAELKATNRFGNSSTAWNLQGKSLTVEQNFQVSRFKVEADGFGKINELLIPILNLTESVAFLN